MTDRIICVTPNAALDRTLVVPDFAIGHISRISGGVVAPGGKGLNMMRAVKILGGHPMSMGLLGGHTGRMVAAMVQESGYSAEWTWFDGETRTCTIIANAEGVSTVINESGQVYASDWRALVDDICRVAISENVSTVCFCGSNPEGVPADAPADAIERLNALGRQVWIDTSGQALSNAIAAKPFAIKVNADELAAAMGLDAKCRTEVINAGKKLLNDGIQIVVISLGSEGALLLAKDIRIKATPPQNPSGGSDRQRGLPSRRHRRRLATWRKLCRGNPQRRSSGHGQRLVRRGSAIRLRALFADAWRNARGNPLQLKGQEFTDS